MTEVNTEYMEIGKRLREATIELTSLHEWAWIKPVLKHIFMRSAGHELPENFGVEHIKWLDEHTTTIIAEIARDRSEVLVYVEMWADFRNLLSLAIEAHQNESNESE